LPKVKKGENFNRRNTLSISRIALKVSADASLRVTKVPKFEPDATIGQISADFERGRFEIGSNDYLCSQELPDIAFSEERILLCEILIKNISKFALDKL